MSEPRILFYDLETFPNLGYTWGKYEQNVLKIVKHWEIASFAYKWRGGAIECVSQRNMSEKQVVKKLHALIDAADISIAHNGDAFDIKKARAKFAQFNLNPTTLNRTVDTKKIAKSQFGFTSNSLNDLGEFLGLGRKLQTGGFDLWLDCMQGAKPAWSLMEKYNRQDVALLERVYNKLKSWVPNHPNIALLMGHEGCPNCGSQNVQSRGFRVTAKTKQHRFYCNDCGAWYIGRKDAAKN